MTHSLKKHATAIIMTLCSCFPLAASTSEDVSDPLERYNIVWETPSLDHNGSMPIGNGDLGANVWVEQGGDLVLLLSKTDAWSENARLLKLGRLRLSLTPNPFKEGQAFKQTLQLRQGEIRVSAGDGKEAVHFTIWIDANNPVIQIEAESQSAFDLRAHLDIWRTEKRELTGKEAISAWDAGDGKTALIIYPDVVADDRRDQIVWYHRNVDSIWQRDLKHQGMQSFIAEGVDPLLHRTFGGHIAGEGLVSEDSRTLKSRSPRKNFTLTVHPLSKQTETIDQWLAELDQSVARSSSRRIEDDHKRHHAWWDAFWNRSWIRVSGFPEADTLNQAYILQRWITACAGRGVHPIKFNGSIFTVDGSGFDADYRRWGGPYWWQNTRLPYWPMLASGDTEMMHPLFKMYQDTLPLAEARTKIWFDHEGSTIGETVHFWGMYASNDYGWKRPDNLPVGEMTNAYIRREYTASLELIAMMLDYYAYTGDVQFLTESLLPVSDSFLTFWDQHYQTDENGQMVMYPAQALETLQDVKNPAPDVAGLRWVLPRLLALPEEVATKERFAFWKSLQAKVPPLPMKGEAGSEFLLGAEEIYQRPKNSENPELYSIFPFRLYGVGKPELGIAQRSFQARRRKEVKGWQQSAIQAALIGDSKTAAYAVVKRAKNKHKESRFPAFWGPNYDWIPDQCNGGVLMMALQSMILQADDGEIRLMPAWPKEWDVDFKLHAPAKTVLQGSYRDGKMTALTVQPVEREASVIVVEKWD